MSSSFIGNQPLTQAQRNVVIHTVTATATYNVNYTVGFLDVLLNGVTLSPEDYTAIDGLTVVLNSPTIVGDSLVTVSWGTFVSSAGVASNDVRLATAWCVFDGTLVGTNAPADGYNIASIQRISTGIYKVSFTVPMDNVNYSVALACVVQSSLVGSFIFIHDDVYPRTVNDFHIFTSNSTGSPGDNIADNVIVFGGKA